METAIGVFDSREKAEQAVKELLQHQIPEQAIVFLTRSESEAMNFGKELGTYAGGFLGGAVGTTAGCVGAALALIPGFGQVFALGVGGAALLGYLGSKAGASIAQKVTAEPNSPRPAESAEDTEHLLGVLKSGRSVVLVQTGFHDVASEATAILNRLGISAGAGGPGTTETSTRQVEGITLIELRGRIAFGSGNTKLRETVSDLTAAGTKHVVFSMAGVTFVDSSGIGELVRGHMAMRKSGGALKLSNVSKPVGDLLKATALDKVFEIFVDEASAVKSFKDSSVASA
ncbi:MAG TPA: STAS domain-containing protein [Dongiaceae bacterium]|nr:STAS domain-containing protein [Dongiaceae bacterium]